MNGAPEGATICPPYTGPERRRAPRLVDRYRQVGSIANNVLAMEAHTTPEDFADKCRRVVQALDALYRETS